MIREDWTRLGAALKGLWPARDLPAGSMYLRLLAPYSIEQIEGALDRLAATTRYAPSPSEVLQAIDTPDSSQPSTTAAGVVAWLTEHMPEVCRVDPKVIAVVRADFGEDAAADRLERSTAPHPAAVAAALQAGHRPLSVREHGPAIRDAVREHNRRFYGVGGDMFTESERTLIEQRRAERARRHGIPTADASHEEPVR